MIKDFLKWTKRALPAFGGSRREGSFTTMFLRFQEILALNNQILDLMADMGDKLGGDYVFDRQYIQSACDQMCDLVYKLIYNMSWLAPGKYQELNDVFRKISSDIEAELAGRLVTPHSDFVLPYEILSRDLIDAVGAKNANIAEIRNQLGLNVPDGFAITVRAYRLFMNYNQLDDKIDRILQALSEGKTHEHEAASSIQVLIMSGAVPPPIAKAVKRSLSRLEERAGDRPIRLALRSSALAEDSEDTFAGQYLSLLNETTENVLTAYKEVLASTYGVSAIEYGQQKGYRTHEVAMAVACQVMTDASKSGVIYTLDPLNPEIERMLLAATWGLGAPVVAGEVTADHYTVSRKADHEVLALDIVQKLKMLVPGAERGCDLVSVPEPLQTKPCLSPEEISEIAEAAMVIERHFKKPQDIEWAIDPKGKLYILQARPIKISRSVCTILKDISSKLKGYPILFSGRGAIAQSGVATGRVFVATTDEDLDAFPEGAILVARQSSPRFARVAGKANGIITDIGSATGHMATIAREFRVPTIVDTRIATQILKSGQEITIDAEHNVIYDGIVRELLYYECTKEIFQETYEYRLLRRVLKRIAPLNLLDPFDRHFTPSACQTYHDITRFIHEKAVEELINLNYVHCHDPNTPARKLKSSIPLDLVIIDIGGGLVEPTESTEVTPDQISSLPMSAFIEGLSTPGVWSSEPMWVDFGSFMSSLTRTFSSTLAAPRYIGQNLAVISKQYMNVSLRLGYHFNMIDAYVGDKLHDNYLYFRFLGGVTEQSRRSRRVKFIAEILAKNDFRINLRRDLLVGRVKKLEERAMIKKLRIIGQLVAFTRQLDVQMTSDQQIARFIGEFDRMTSSDATMESIGRAK